MDRVSKNADAVLLYLYENRESETSLDTEAIIKGTGLAADDVRQALTELSEAGLIRGPPSLLTMSMNSLKEMDEKFTPVSAGYAEHIILVASILARANEKYLAAELGYDPETVALVGSRLRSSGVWEGDQVNPSHLKTYAEEMGGTAFFLDGAVARGDLQIVGRTPKPQYQMTDSGKRNVTRMFDRGTGGSHHAG